MRLNTPPPIMEDDNDDDLPIADDDLEIIDDDELDNNVPFSDDEDENDPPEEHMENPDEELELQSGSSSWIDHAKWVFKKHTASVFCCAVDKNNSLIVTGGEDDKAYVWNMITQELFFECIGHLDSVTNVGFNHDSTLLATGDMKGIIKVWKVSEKSKVWEFETSDLRWLEWHKSANILFAGTLEGEAWMWLVPSGITKTFPSFGSPVTCGKLLQDGKRMVLGYEDGSVRLWDLKSVNAVHAITGVSAHTESVLSIDSSSDNAVICSGSEDASVKFINVATGKILTTFEIDTSSVETIAFSPRSSLVAMGTLNGTIVIWDVSSQSVRHTIKDKGVVVKIVWHPIVEKFFVACLAGHIILVDARSGQEEGYWKGHRGDILDIILTSDGSKIITACDDHECRIFECET